VSPLPQRSPAIKKPDLAELVIVLAEGICRPERAKREIVSGAAAATNRPLRSRVLEQARSGMEVTRKTDPHYLDS
jgi:hypothetical protein